MRVQQRNSTLKAFVRVSKNNDGPLGKDDAKPAMRMTRSRAAALAVESKEVEPQESPKKSDAGLTTTPARKRKLGVESDKLVGSPAKRVTRAARTPVAKRLPAKGAAAKGAVAKEADTKEAAKQRVKKTTINAYFSSKKQVAVPKAVEPATAESLLKPQDPTSVQDNSSADIPLTTNNELTAAKESSAPANKELAPVKSDPAAERTERATTMLQRLRNRKRPAPTAAATAKIEETRAIQDAIRARREKPAESAQPAEPTQPAENTVVASFERPRVRTAEELKMRELKRQFVEITSRTGGHVPLPRAFRKLSSLFQALEHTVMFGGASAAGVVYHRVRKGVESMAQHTFGWQELGQILAVYPEAYAYSDHATTLNGRRVQSVVLTPVARGITLALEMEARRDEFARRLIARVSSAHKSFLVSRGYGDADIADISGWHPSFDIESTPAVSPIALQPAPHAVAGSVASFDREKLKHLLGSSHKPAPEPAASKEPVGKDAAQPEPEHKIAVLALPTPTDSPVLNSSMSLAKPKERPTSSASALLERIRAKQRAREQAEKRVSAVPAATRTMHSRLPGVLAAISFLYYAERKRVLPLLYVVDKLCESEGLDKTEAIGHVAALAKFVPEWCVVDDPDPENPSPDARLKVTRAISMQEAKTQLQSKIDAVEKPI
ncbi:hypothetical protein GGF43_001285 [Coemansia sp. RSA 2618]|nr:hypothetical protein GGF43_001285 [Coemansia sp. RSA 2618]